MFFMVKKPPCQKLSIPVKIIVFSFPQWKLLFPAFRPMENALRIFLFNVYQAKSMGKGETMIQQAIQNLMDGVVPDRELAHGVMEQIMTGGATDAQIAGYLVALRLVGETADVIAGSAEAMREACTRNSYTTHPDVVDTCGTGGDGSHTFNISTATAIVTAAAGIPVAKHGNRSVSSRSGSADVLAPSG